MLAIGTCQWLLTMMMLGLTCLTKLINCAPWQLSRGQAGLDLLKTPAGDGHHRAGLTRDIYMAVCDDVGAASDAYLLIVIPSELAFRTPWGSRDTDPSSRRCGSVQAPRRCHKRLGEASADRNTKVFVNNTYIGGCQEVSNLHTRGRKALPQ